MTSPSPPLSCSSMPPLLPDRARVSRRDGLLVTSITNGASHTTHMTPTLVSCVTCCHTAWPTGTSQAGPLATPTHPTSSPPRSVTTPGAAALRGSYACPPQQLDKARHSDNYCSWPVTWRPTQDHDHGSACHASCPHLTPRTRHDPGHHPHLHGQPCSARCLPAFAACRPQITTAAVAAPAPSSAGARTLHPLSYATSQAQPPNHLSPAPSVAMGLDPGTVLAAPLQPHTRLALYPPPPSTTSVLMLLHFAQRS